MKKHFVSFYSPGTFVSEETTEPVDNWDINAAVERAKTVLERHGATPYGFRFSTRTRSDDDLDSKVSNRSPMYYLGGKVETLAEVEARATPKDTILLGNMRCNEYDRIITNDNSWRFTAPLGKEDVVLEFTPPERPK